MTIEALRESMQRTHDQNSKAHKVSEVIDKHGRSHWLGPLLDELGPTVQLQLRDMADMLEILNNFSAEWSFQYLRRKAQVIREELIAEVVENNLNCGSDNDVTSTTASPMRNKLNIIGNVSDSGEDDDWHSTTSTLGVLEDSDIVTYSAFAQGVLGQMLIYSKGIRFVRKIKAKELWRFPFLTLAEMRKTECSSVPKLLLGSSQALELKFNDGKCMTIEGLEERDDAFNTIIAVSQLRWKSL
ncbi:MAG: hypothetical protein Q9220_003940 [cf. Caloplaca sp. 1 TL-2023]